MEKSVSADEANRHFPQILRSVREGESFTITSQGEAVARIVPVDPNPDPNPDRAEAKRRLLESLRDQPVIDVGPWTRDELYDR